MDTEHDAFCFRIAHTDVVFDNHRLAFYVDKSEEDETFVGDVFFFQSVDRRFDNTCAYFLHEHFIGERNGGYTTHTACIQSFIAFADTFVVFGNGEDLIVFSICQYEHGALDTT